MSLFSLENKTAVVTGGASGIGEAISKAFACQGAHVHILEFNAENGERVVGEIEAKGGKANFHACDVSNNAQVAEIISAIGAKNYINILVNNTGGPPAGQAIDAKLDEFQSAFNQHLLCNHILATALVPGMKASGYGRIINVISTSVKQPLSNLGVSNTIRGAVANWSKTLANELGQFNITVNNVLPGATNTLRLKNIVENKANQTGQKQEDVLAAMGNQVPMKRVAEPEEVANAIAFLASPAASYINGINVPVDGGRTGCL